VIEYPITEVSEVIELIINGIDNQKYDLFGRKLKINNA
jgi:hypothetical protein